jgi:predicted CoA-binding protein
VNREGRILDDDDELGPLLRGLRRIAVLGIRSERFGDRPAHYVPAALAASGVAVVPVPVHEPEVREILGAPVVRSLGEISGTVDLVNVFRRAEDLPAHLDALLALRPPAVWLQSGIRDDDFARALTRAGIDVVQDRCLMVEHRRMTRA